MRAKGTRRGGPPPNWESPGGRPNRGRDVLAGFGLLAAGALIAFSALWVSGNAPGASQSTPTPSAGTAAASAAPSDSPGGSPSPARPRPRSRRSCRAP